MGEGLPVDDGAADQLQGERVEPAAGGDDFLGQVGEGFGPVAWLAARRGPGVGQPPELSGNIAVAHGAAFHELALGRIEQAAADVRAGDVNPGQRRQEPLHQVAVDVAALVEVAGVVAGLDSLSP